MAYWLMKQEPTVWGWDQLVAEKGAAWDGVRNHQAAANLRKMATGDRCFMYHSVEQKAIVGVMKVTRAAYPDPTAAEGEPWVVVDVEPVAAAQRPVTLQQIKADPVFADFALLRQSRLSVVPVSPEHWERLCKMAGLPPR